MDNNYEVLKAELDEAIKLEAILWDSEDENDTEAWRMALKEVKRLKQEIKPVAKVRESKKRVVQALKSGKNVGAKINKELKLSGTQFIDEKLNEYGYVATYWSAHTREKKDGIESVKQHYKVIKRIIN